ncbi:O-methyltransferase [Kribbella sp.]|uniref:O-methyltransferase n=1 Tax=Kribbella sp. TaxID=1871183 RepID=UPI002D3F501B|nr:class I SAM-dependent methyltransferase [Kribbella sp.]HZX08620.1 class I SAM-dependent methyltransferase [Kribbella sp.]
MPGLVLRAELAAAEVGMPLRRTGTGPSCCLPDAGRFLAMLAAGCTGGTIGESGTGVGYGAAWIASAMPADCRLVTVESDETRVAAARRVFADEPRVEVIHGDAAVELISHAPFDLLFADGGRQPPDIVELLRVGGRLVCDDVTPMELLPADSPFRLSDPKREFFFRNPRLVATEVVLPDRRNSLLVGTRTV